MPHRRFGRRLMLHWMDPETRLLLLTCLRVPKHVLARHTRAVSPAALAALLDPRRKIASNRAPRVAHGKAAGKVAGPTRV